MIYLLQIGCGLLAGGDARCSMLKFGFVQSGPVYSERGATGKLQAAMIRIVDGDLADPRVIALLAMYVTNARAQTAPGSAHALDLGGLKSPGISFWTIWDDESVLGMGALKRLSADHGEVKSMYTVPSARRKGIGTAMLRHIIGAARARGMARISLETGSWDYFQPARALYKRHGFVECGPFGDYVDDPNSLFMSLDLQDSRSADVRLT